MEPPEMRRQYWFVVIVLPVMLRRQRTAGSRLGDYACAPSCSNYPKPSPASDVLDKYPVTQMCDSWRDVIEA